MDAWVAATEPSAASSTISANPTSITADGTTTSTITVTVKLSDGTAISYDFDRGTTGAYTGTIELINAVPSPAGLALLGLAGLVRSRRR